MTTQEIFNKLSNGNAEILLNAVASYNADAFLIEDMETAEEVAEILLKDSASVMTVSNSEAWDWVASYEKLDFTSLNEPERIISANGILICLSGDYKPLDMVRLKEQMKHELVFTEDDYVEKAGAYFFGCDFDTFLENNLKTSIENHGTLDDAVFNAYYTLSKMDELLPRTMSELAEQINTSEDYPVNMVNRAIEYNGWYYTDQESDYHICTDGTSSLVIDCNNGKAVVR